MKALLIALLLGAVALVMARWLPNTAQAPLPEVTNDSTAVEVPVQKGQEKSATVLPMIDTVAERQRPSPASRVDHAAAFATSGEGLA